jgi:hypothetical protein
MEHGKESDHCLDGAGSPGEQQTVAFDSTPVRWPMHRGQVALELLSDSLPELLPIGVHFAGDR